MSDKHPIEKLVNSSVDHLIKENTDHSWGEAIAIIIANMKDKDGLFMMPRLVDDYAEHIRLCVVLASALRMYIDSNILNSIPKNIKKKEWVGLTDEEIRRTDHHRVDGAYDYSFKQGAQWADATLQEKNT